MCDPLSIASGVAGLVTLADVVIERTYKTIICCKNAGKDSQRLLLEVQSLVGILKSLHVLEIQVSNAVLSTVIPAHLRHQCQMMLERLRDKLGDANPRGKPSKLRQVEKMLKWPLTSSETEDTLAEIERYKSAFNLAISMDALEAILASSSDRHDLQQELKGINDHLCRIELSKEKDKVLSFFGTYDSQSNNATSVKLRQRDTCLWLSEGPQLQHWLSARNGKLWLYGIPGAGKTVLAGVIIAEAVMMAAPLVGVAYYYCDYKEPRKRELRSILASIAGQLALQSNVCYELLRKTYRPSQEDVPIRSLPDAEHLQGLLIKMSTHFDEVFLVVDAIDECNNAAEVAQALRTLVEGPGSNLKLATLSRNEQDIRDHLSHFTSISIAALNSDLRLYVSAQIEERSKNRRLRIKSPGLKDEILEHLVNKADGMFRWVACQMDHLCELPNDAARRKALMSLPPDLNTTYARILERINERPEPTKLLVERVLAWLIHGREDTEYFPDRLTAKQICSAVSIEDGQRVMDKEAEPDIEDIMLYCSSLIRLSPDNEYLELAHFTVEEYLRSSISETDKKLGRYRPLSRQKALYKARTCLTVLIMDHFAKMLPSLCEEFYKRHRQFPLYEYAASNWMLFVSDDNFGASEFDALSRLFSSRESDEINSNFKTWSQAFLVGNSYDMLGVSERRVPSPFLLECERKAHASPLHFACMLRCRKLVAMLLQQQPDTDQAGPLGVPLHCALMGRNSVWMSSHLNSRLYAVSSLSVEAVERSRVVIWILLIAGASPDRALTIRDGPDQSMFWLACINGHAATFIVYGVSPDRFTLQTLLQLYKSGPVLPIYKDVVRMLHVDIVAPEDRGIFSELCMRSLEDLPGAVENITRSSIEWTSDFSLNDAIFLTCKTDNLGLVKYLHLKYKPDLLDIRDESGSSLLIRTMDHHAANIAAWLFDIGADIRERTTDGDTLLHRCMAVQSSSRPQLLRLLISKGADVNAIDSNGTPAYFRCPWFGTDVEFALFLAAKPDLQMTDKSKSSVWHLVALADQTLIFELLKKLNEWDMEAAMSSMNDDGLTPVHVAALRSPSIFRRLFQDGLVTAQRSSDGRTCLHFAVRGMLNRSDKTAFELLTAVANKHTATPSSDGSVPAHDLLNAAADKLTHCIELENDDCLLIEFGLRRLLEIDHDLTSSRSDGFTPLHVLCERLLAIPYHSISVTLELLLASGSSPLARDQQERTPLDLCIASVTGDGDVGSGLGVLQALVTKVSDEELRKYRYCGQPLLHIAAMHRMHALCQTLLARGGDVDFSTIRMAPELDPFRHLGLTSPTGLTALEILAISGCEDRLFRSAVQSSKRLHSVNDWGLSLLHLAAFQSPWNAIGSGKLDRKPSCGIDILLEAGIRVEQPTRCDTQETALHIAVSNANEPAVQRLLELGADIHTTSSKGWNAIAYACQSGHSEILDALLANTVVLPLTKYHFQMLNVTIQIGPFELATCYSTLHVLPRLWNEYHRYDQTSEVSAMWCAAYHADIEAVRVLFDMGQDTGNVYAKKGWSVLHAAAQGGSVEVVRVLLETAFEFQLYDNRGLLPSYYALSGQHMEVVHMLRIWEQKRCFVDPRTHSRDQDRVEGSGGGRSGHATHALEIATTEGNLVLLTLLLETGTPVDAVLSCGICTPLVVASQLMNTDICKYLIKNGASLVARGCEAHGCPSYTALHIAAGHPSMIDVLELMLERPDVPAHLLFGAETSDPAYSLLHSAAWKGNALASGLLLRRGASINCQGVYDGRTPLHRAAAEKHPEVVKLLIEGGADINMMDFESRTPLHVAAQLDDLRSVSLLVTAGANVNLRDVTLRAPASYAAWHNRDDLLKVLQTKSSASFNISSDNGMLPIMEAACDGNCEPLKYLIALGHSVDSLANNRHSARSFFLDGAKCKLRSYALHSNSTLLDPHMLYGWRDNNSVDLRMIFKKFDNAALLRSINSAITSRRNRLFRTRPTYETVITSSPRVMQLLTAHGALLNLEGGPEGTPLMAACAYGRLDLVKSLVRLGALENYTKGGISFSALAKARLYPKIVRWLLVGRYVEPLRLTALDDSDPNERCESAGVWGQDDETPRRPINLDLVFWEDWEEYLEKLQPDHVTVYVPRSDGAGCMVIERVRVKGMKKCEHCGARPQDRERRGCYIV